MRGHSALIAMRLRRRIPAFVTLDTDAATGPADCDDWHLVNPMYASVWIEPNDPIERLDLRFVVGLPVIVSGTDPERVERVGHAAQLAQAKRVITHVSRRLNANRFETLRHTDTLGAYAWPDS
jgi:hypothetical protein